MSEGLFFAAWRKSSFSGSDHNRVEVAFLDGGAPCVIRSGSTPAWPCSRRAKWNAFIGGVKLGEFDRI
jgi:hypothetical protein